MSGTERESWDQRYSAPGYIYGDKPAKLLVEQQDVLPESGRALDIACGEGQNAVFLARRGLDVEALDISAVALRKAQALATNNGVSIKPRLWDLKQSYLPEGPFDVIVAFHYKQEDLAPRIVESLAQGGVLLMEINTVENLKLHRRPTRQYLVEPNELLTWFPTLFVLTYREGIEDNHAVAQLVARKPN